MSMLKKALIYLGLGPDEEYEQYDDFAPAGEAGSGEEHRPVVRAVAPSPVVRPASSTVRPVPAATTPSTSVRAVPATEPSTVAPSPVSRPAAQAPPADGASAIRIVEAVPTKPHAVTPTSFNEAQGIGDRFKLGQPVIVNLQGVERDLRRRLVDFASGLCYALGGKMDRVADQVYLLTPADVEVSSDDTRRALD
jgi:cell division inhibitor SepF